MSVLTCHKTVKYTLTFPPIPVLSFLSRAGLSPEPALVYMSSKLLSLGWKVMLHAWIALTYLRRPQQPSDKSKHIIMAMLWFIEVNESQCSNWRISEADACESLVACMLWMLILMEYCHLVSRKDCMLHGSETPALFTALFTDMSCFASRFEPSFFF